MCFWCCSAAASDNTNGVYERHAAHTRSDRFGQTSVRLLASSRWSHNSHPWSPFTANGKLDHNEPEKNTSSVSDVQTLIETVQMLYTV